MSKYCNGCVFRQHINGQMASNCGYALITGKLRGCPAGEGCPYKTDKLPKRCTQKERSDRFFKGFDI